MTFTLVLVRSKYKDTEVISQKDSFVVFIIKQQLKSTRESFSS